MSKKYTQLYVLFAVTFIVLSTVMPGPILVLMKIMPALLLAGLFWQRQKLMVLALCLCAAGDAFLHLDRQNYFIPGLVSFLIAHLIYVWHFWQKRTFNSTGIKAMAVPIFMAGLLAIKLLPHLGALTVPVLIYASAICAMGVAAALAGPRPGLGYLGALIFIISDSTIAWDKFIEPIPMAGLIIMITYYLGNYLIALGMLKLSEK